jgi:hypothetical protein
MLVFPETCCLKVGAATIITRITSAHVRKMAACIHHNAARRMDRMVQEYGCQMAPEASIAKLPPLPPLRMCCLKEVVATIITRITNAHVRRVEACTHQSAARRTDRMVQEYGCQMAPEASIAKLQRLHMHVTAVATVGITTSMMM